MKNILITGGTGFIGSHICLVLLNKGYEITIVDSLINSSPVVIERLKEFCKSGEKNVNRINFEKGDLRNQDFLSSLFETYYKKGLKFDAVLHLAGLKSVKESTQEPLKYWDYNLIGTINLLKIMGEYRCTNLVFSSSATIYGSKKDNTLIDEYSLINPINAYGYTKATIERILEDLSKTKNQKWRIASLRYFNPVGAHYSGRIGENPLDNPNNILPIITKVAAGLIDELKIFGNDWDTPDGTGIRDYIHVMDLAEGHLISLEKILNNEFKFIKLNLGTAKGTSVLELIKTFEKVNKVKVPYRYCLRRDGDVAYSVADNSLAKSILNWIPKRDLEEMCRDSWNWYKNNPKGF